MTAPMELLDLVERFVRNIEDYKAPGYNETQIRREFVDPFFRALGWDVDNTQGYAEAYKDVIHEDAIKVGGATKAPDYCFRIGGTRKFFVEAKRPSTNIKNEQSSAYQLRRYAWSAKLPLSILTNFAELAVYDCRIKPDQSDSASTARILYFNCEEFGERWNELAGVFAREEVMKGAFDRYAESKKRRGTAEVDTAFLMEIESWRDQLARNVALRNTTLSQRELNFSVQRIIDRIIFLRMCEDRGIENYGRLMAIQNGERVYQRLHELFRRADERYNSGLFHFNIEKERPEAPDTLTPSLAVDDRVLKDILRTLYYPESPYEFSVLPADILGQVYEQFLGKIIRLTAGHRAVVEEKPEVKKAGGVFYTPTYVVDYIVRQTVGRLLEGKKPGPRGGASKLRVLDPSCGSGSFLLGAYQFLLDWHRDQYLNDGPEKHRRELYQGHGGEWRLSTAERKRILLNNIFGVDIDQQAVEMTKLSLLLKVLEGETEQTLDSQMRLFHERALPDLSRNIKCGNSLIGPDFYNGHQMQLFDEDERFRINAFDWKAEFPEVMKDGGFDAVVGNPPYGAKYPAPEGEYLAHNYSVFSKAAKDIFTCFIERATSLLQSNGFLSFIVPSSWLGGPDYRLLREHVLKHQIDNFVLLPFDVFKTAYIDTCIFAVTKSKPSATHAVRTFVFPKREKITELDLPDKAYMKLRQREWQKSRDKKFVLNPVVVKLLRGIERGTAQTLESVVAVRRGVLFDADFLHSEQVGGSLPYFTGDVYRYTLNCDIGGYVELGDNIKEGPKDSSWYEGERILLRRLVSRKHRLMATMVNKLFVTNKNLYIIKPILEDLPPQVVLAILNSKLMSFLYINQITQAVKDDFPQSTIRDIVSLPFPESLNKTKKQKLVALVDTAIALNERLGQIKIPHDIAVLNRDIQTNDRKIDSLIYQLYLLTDEQIELVEGSFEQE